MDLLRGYYKLGSNMKTALHKNRGNPESLKAFFSPHSIAVIGASRSEGKIAFMSQSGALCTSVLDIALAQDVRFSRFVSLGNKADLNEIDFLEAWSEDSESKVIMAYLEGISELIQ